MKNMFSIGELSKLQNISKQTLIYYDKIDLFKPEYTDLNTGYRYYGASQIDYLDTIIIMKEMGFSLKSIKSYMKDYNISTAIPVLEKQIGVIDFKLQKLESIKKRLSNRLYDIKRVRDIINSNEKVKIKHIEEQYVLCFPVESPYSLKECSVATKQCFSWAKENDLPIYYQSGVCVPLEKIMKGNYVEASFAFIVTDLKKAGKRVRRIEGGRCVSLFHVGAYEDIGRSYRELLSYCTEKDIKIISDAYEFCINDYITSKDKAEFVTEIVFFIED